MHNLSDEELQILYTWIDSIPLSRPKKNISRDFSDAVLAAEIIKYFFPHLIEVHNYPAASSVPQKVYNWHTLNRKIFKKLNFQMSTDLINAVSAAKSGYIEICLFELKTKIEEFLNGGSYGDAYYDFALRQQHIDPRMKSPHQMAFMGHHNPHGHPQFHNSNHHHHPTHHLTHPHHALPHHQPKLLPAPESYHPSNSFHRSNSSKKDIIEDIQSLPTTTSSKINDKKSKKPKTPSNKINPAAESSSSSDKLGTISNRSSKSQAPSNKKSEKSNTKESKNSNNSKHTDAVDRAREKQLEKKLMEMLERMEKMEVIIDMKDIKMKEMQQKLKSQQQSFADSDFDERKSQSETPKLPKKSSLKQKENNTNTSIKKKTVKV